MKASNPHPAQSIVAEIESLERSRRAVLIAVVVTSAAWMLPQIVQSVMAESIPRLLNNALIITGILGALAFTGFMLRYHHFQTKVHGDPQLRSHLDDERIVELRKEAIYRGWFTVMVMIAAGVGIAPFAELPDQAILLALMLVAGNAPILFFLALDRD